MTQRLCAVIVSLACLGFYPASASASDLTLPTSARLVMHTQSSQDSYAMAVEGFAAGRIEARSFQGAVSRKTWRLTGAEASTLHILAPLRDQLVAQGYDILFECREVDCGGFDFRFGIDVVQAPDMHVNIRDFRYLAARRGKDEALSLLVSRLGQASFVQMISTSLSEGEAPEPEPVGPADVGGPALEPVDENSARPETIETLSAFLQTHGHVVLSDLVFETGSARLGPSRFKSLQQLSDYLRANPDQRIALVGHTDTVGSLDANISLSKRRADSVRERMAVTYKISGTRIDAEGMGYLAPVESNLTPQGRDANRRVEAILLSQ